ncbi:MULTISPECIES: glycosyltransferase family A protein [unclassified Nostoc]|uniref:glycosyltransferase family 2 protein n=1 Tax=unclassified Nostoc TaxID=2593658 RepID=UPI002AD253DF|nr:MULTISPECIES: glycosyltransferase family A protein [unclassified Nostoc]MDZ8121404.1 glycosyltransferase family A protein [Nostoc sp. CmiVER01]MDZ8224906.1 glycosyltransferase family A protein [Nostoc sp. ChiVER01]
MPKVTVIIPAYNAMTYLPETLDSVLKQRFTDFEVLIINDGSTDSIVTWVSKITDYRVKLISQENQGLSAARNTGIVHAQGEYVAFLDADDLWEPTKLEKQVHCLDSKPEVGLVYTWTLLVDQQGISTGTVTASHTEGNIWEKLLLGDIIGSGSSAMIRRSCFETVGLFDTELSSIEDCDMWVRIAAIYPFAVIKEVLVYYRQHFTNMSKDYNKMMQNSRLKIEKKFQNVPFELLYLRPRAYGHAFLWLAWKIMFDGGDPEKASYFSQQAILYYPQMKYSAKFLRLQFVLILVRLFGSDSYTQLKNLTHKLRGGVFQYHQ